MLLLRYHFVLLLSFLALTASAQDPTSDAPLARPGLAQTPAAEPFPQNFRAPDRTQLAYHSVQTTYTVTTAADDGTGSLREAIEMANANEGLDAIAFSIDGGGSYEEIFLQTPLPVVSDPVVIDGDTQGCDTSGGPCIRLDGEPLVDDPDEVDTGITLVGGGSTVHGLLFTRFYYGEVQAALAVYSGGNTVTGCYFGTDRTGMVTDPDGTPDSGDELGNGFGIVVVTYPEFLPAADNVIGGTTAEERNVIAGSTFSGIIIQNEGTENNLVIGNYVGTNAAGTGALGNGQSGITMIGGAAQNIAEDNLLSGNTMGGITLQAGTSGNLVSGNFIGTDAAGTAAVPNGTLAGLASLDGIGVSLLSGTDNVIEDNLISGNLLAGVILGAAFTDNIVTGNTVRGNLIGTDAAGLQPVPNGVRGVDDVGFGIALFAVPGVTVSGNIIGGDGEDDANVIGYNTTAGIGAEGPGVTGNVIDGNVIGLTLSEDPAPNGLLGILLRNGPSANQVGQLEPGDDETDYVGNLIGFQPLGVGLGDGTTGNEIAFNTIVGEPGTFLPVDLGLDGPTANDIDDPDEGPQRLQNAPVIEAASLSGEELSVTFHVETALANAAYPLTIRFYERALDEGALVYLPLGSASYPEEAAGQSHTSTFTLPFDELFDNTEVVATATDADGNTGEVSLVGSAVPTVPLTEPTATHAVSAVFPNPATSSAQLTLAVPNHQHVEVHLYDLLGRHVAVLLDEPVAGGTPRSVRLDAADLPSGTYFVRVTGERFTEVRTVTLLR